jgi:AraC-like DNA-binding protein
MGYIFRGNDFSDFLTTTHPEGMDVFSPDNVDPGKIRLFTPKGEISYHEFIVEDITIFGKGESHLLEMHFNLSQGDIYYHNNSINREVAPAMTGNITFLSPDENKAKIAFNKDQAYHTFDIHLPLSIFAKYAGESKTMDHFLNCINNNHSTTLSPLEIKMNPRIYSTIQAMQHCSFEGLTKRIFLESKIYELIAYLHESCECNDNGSRLTTADNERIKYAAALIRENLNNPFTIVELARKVGINQTKLKSGFKVVFGTTVFGYLQETRMDIARQQILDTSLTIQQISSLSGYKNISNFSTAFKQTYGYAPNTLRAK